MAWPAVKRGFTQEQFREYVQNLQFGPWRPSLIVWHNTAAPSLEQWQKTAAADKAKGLVPGTTRIGNLEKYFRDDNGWSGAPHLFIADDLIWVFNRLDKPGVHSPSWNSISIGIEMVADFDREDDDAGAGLKVKNNTIFATAILCETFGLDPYAAIRLHKEDPRTTHDCPGKDFAQDKAKAVDAVAALRSAGDHGPHDGADAPAIAAAEQRGTTTATDLNFRAGPGVTNECRGSLPKGTELIILDRARNGSTEWLKVKTPAGYVGWVAGLYVTIKP
jgi:hypothetical protein